LSFYARPGFKKAMLCRVVLLCCWLTKWNLPSVSESEALNSQKASSYAACGGPQRDFYFD